MKALVQRCELRKQGGMSRAPQSIAALDRRAVKSNCRDPVESRASASTAEIDCDPETGRRTLDEARSVFSGGGSGNDCQSNEQPGTDGTCRGRRPVTSLGQRGRFGGNIWWPVGNRDLRSDCLRSGRTLINSSHGFAREIVARDGPG